MGSTGTAKAGRARSGAQGSPAPAVASARVPEADEQRTRRLPASWRIPLVLGLLFLLGVLVRYEMWRVFGGVQPSYTTWADRFYFGGITRGYLSGVDVLRDGGPWKYVAYPPGYASWLLVMESTAGSLQAARMLQASLDALTVVPLYYVVRSLRVGPALSAVAAATYALLPLWAFGSTTLLGESLTPAAFVWVLALVVAARGRQSLALWGAAGAFAGLAALVRPDLLPLGLAIAVLAGGTMPGRRKLAVLVAFGAFAVPVGSWGVYNRVVNDHWLFTSTSGNYTTWAGLGQIPNDHGFFVSDARAGEYLAERGIRYHSFEAEAFWRDAYLDAWREHPGHVLEVISWRMVRIPVQYREDAVDQVGYLDGAMDVVQWGGMVVLLPVGFLLLRRRRYSDLLIVALPLGYALGTLGIVYFEDRYIRYVPLTYVLALAVAASLAAERLRRSVSLSTRTAVGVTAAVAVAGGLYLGSQLLILDRAGDDAQRDADIEAAATAADGDVLLDVKAADWQVQVPTADVKTLPDGTLSVLTSEAPSAYQVAVPVTTGDADGFVVDYDITVTDGQVALGVLNESGSEFLEVVTLPGKGRHQLQLSGQLRGSTSVTVVVMNARAEPGRSAFSIASMQVSKISAGGEG